MRVLFFASLRESLGQSELDLPLPLDVGTVGQLREHLAGRGGDWAALAATRNLRMAVNQTLAGSEASITDADEVAFFPPVTGG